MSREKSITIFFKGESFLIIFGTQLAAEIIYRNRNRDTGISINPDCSTQEPKGTSTDRTPISLAVTTAQNPWTQKTLCKKLPNSRCFLVKRFNQPTRYLLDKDGACVKAAVLFWTEMTPLRISIKNRHNQWLCEVSLEGRRECHLKASCTAPAVPGNSIKFDVSVRGKNSEWIWREDRQRCNATHKVQSYQSEMSSWSLVTTPGFSSRSSCCTRKHFFFVMFFGATRRLASCNLSQVSSHFCVASAFKGQFGKSQQQNDW